MPATAAALYSTAAPICPNRASMRSRMEDASLPVQPHDQFVQPRRLLLGLRCHLQQPLQHPPMLLQDRRDLIHYPLQPGHRLRKLRRLVLPAHPNLPSHRPSPTQ